jgi:hypothetical protein
MDKKTRKRVSYIHRHIHTYSRHDSSAQDTHTHTHTYVHTQIQCRFDSPAQDTHTYIHTHIHTYSADLIRLRKIGRGGRPERIMMSNDAISSYFATGAMNIPIAVQSMISTAGISIAVQLYSYSCTIRYSYSCTVDDKHCRCCSKYVYILARIQVEMHACVQVVC